MFARYFLVCFIGLLSCCPQSQSYRDCYEHIHVFHPPRSTFSESDFFLVILVDAKHLDYTQNRSFLFTVAKHPRNGNKSGDLGHAWIYLQGCSNGEKIVIEGGHSGERGRIQAKYFDGIMNYIEYGYANPTEEEKGNPRHEPNPVKYLWATQEDGFFQEGSGGHVPTFAAKVNISEAQFKRILAFLDKYPFSQYALTSTQCSSFVEQVVRLAGWKMNSTVTMSIDPVVYFGEREIRLWEDPTYSKITFSTPDAIERSLMWAVQEGRAEYALDWYLGQR